MLSLIPLPYKIALILAIVLGAFSYGYTKGNARAEAEIAKFAARASELQAALEKEQSNIKEKVITEYVDKIQKVKEKQYVYVKQAEEVVPNQYNLSNGWVYLHDASASGADADNARASDATASDVKDNQALSVIIDNYGTCKRNAEQLAALQDYIAKVKAAVDKANKNPVEVKMK